MGVRLGQAVLRDADVVVACRSAARVSLNQAVSQHHAASPAEDFAAGSHSSVRICPPAQSAVAVSIAWTMESFGCARDPSMMRVTMLG